MKFLLELSDLLFSLKNTIESKAFQKNKYFVLMWNNTVSWLKHDIEHVMSKYRTITAFLGQCQLNNITMSCIFIVVCNRAWN